MKTLIEKWSSYETPEKVAECVDMFLKASPSDKCIMINEAFGIFDGSVKGNVYTYYFYSVDGYMGSLMNVSGKTRYNLWRKVLQCFRVDYNFITEEIKVRHTRFNKRCTENMNRII